VHEGLITRFCAKIDRNRENIIRYEERYMQDAEVAVVCYGAASRPALGAVVRARSEGRKVGYFRLITVWPFCGERVSDIGKQVSKIIVPEMNLGQISREVERFVSVPVVPVSKIGGVPHSVEEVYMAIEREMR